MSNWNWKVVRQFLKRSFDLGLSRSSCLNYLHRLGFVLKRPKKRLLKAKDEERKAFVLQYRQIREEAQDLLRGRSPLSGRCRPEGQMGVARSACFGGLHQSPVGREGQLLLGSLSGEWGGGSHGDSWKQHCRDLHRLFTAAKRKPSWTSGSDLGQWASPPRSSDSQLFDHSELASAVGGLTGLQSRLQCRRSRLGLGQRRGHGQRMPRNKSQSPREDESILRRANSS